MSRIGASDSSKLDNMRCIVFALMPAGQHLLGVHCNLIGHLGMICYAPMVFIRNREHLWIGQPNVSLLMKQSVFIAND